MQLVLSGAILAARTWRGHGVGHTPSLAQHRDASSGSIPIEKLVLTEKRQTGIGDGHEGLKKKGVTGVAKREWGAKHTCMSCGVKFYDLQRNPIACPKCGNEVEVETARPNRRRPPVRQEAAAPAKEEAVIAVVAGGSDETADDDSEETIDDIDDDDNLVKGIDDAVPAQPES